ncbi:hypothetical protein [Larsenimonas suaedae]|uniref:DUF3552 domain-containing protein n=1 Tax=Larsenimonas suaedae TaxID=1851019 RepID=A0ABU1GZ60_9GAMM|nr:hypothetical protein [Larsenimonas suaedae]MCM2973807.1 hypothetical protein [Larsenimonas suaedae]MDR5897331.1 hypothetical protein [Larsenimonas suaedae]
MARRSSGFNTAVRTFKAIDRACKQAERDAQRRKNAKERAQTKASRELDRQLKAEEKAFERERKELERQLKADEKAFADAQKEQSRMEIQAIKDEQKIAKECFEQRMEERVTLREDIIREYMD